jgi:tetraacyldisaccharide 4'-kinase
MEPPRSVEPYGRLAASGRSTRVLAVAGIARPDRFFAGLRRMGFEIVREMRFRDHHPFSRPDVEHIVRAARATRAELVVTTEKDLMRLLPLRPIPAPLAWVPLNVRIEPELEFRSWLQSRINESQGSGRSRTREPDAMHRRP